MAISTHGDQAEYITITPSPEMRAAVLAAAGLKDRVSVQAAEGSDLAAAAAAEQDAITRADLAIEACKAASAEYKRACDAYDEASQVQLDAVEAQLEARRAHIAAMRAAGVAQTADGYVPR